jgi:uncharacterized protein (UPF0218 family)
LISWQERPKFAGEVLNVLVERTVVDGEESQLVLLCVDRLGLMHAVVVGSPKKVVVLRVER